MLNSSVESPLIVKPSTEKLSDGTPSVASPSVVFSRLLKASGDSVSQNDAAVVDDDDDDDDGVLVHSSSRPRTERFLLFLLLPSTYPPPSTFSFCGDSSGVVVC
jgi:hypothetical protein